MSQAKPESREMYAEIAALVAAVAKAFEMSEDAAAQALESRQIALDFGQDANGNRFVMARFGERQARIYQGAIKHQTPGN